VIQEGTKFEDDFMDFQPKKKKWQINTQRNTYYPLKPDPCLRAWILRIILLKQ
jgi:hypothetical protein